MCRKWSGEELRAGLNAMRFWTRGALEAGSRSNAFCLRSLFEVFHLGCGLAGGISCDWPPPMGIDPSHNISGAVSSRFPPSTHSTAVKLFQVLVVTRG